MKHEIQIDPHIKIIDNCPSATQMRQFCDKYRADWDILCYSRSFIKAVSENLIEAEEIAKKMLSEKKPGKQTIIESI